MKKLLTILICLVLAFSLCACGAKTEGTDEGGKTEAETWEAKLAGMKACAVLVSDRGDGGTVDMLCLGLERLQKDYGLQLDIKQITDDYTDLAAVESAFYDVCDLGYDLIFGVTNLDAGIVGTVAVEYPDTDFFLIHNEFDFDTYPLENVYCGMIKQNEGCYLAGALAAKMSTTGTIGWVGCIEMTLIKDFMVGYIEGAQYANPDIKVITSYTNDPYSPEKGLDVASAQIALGADVVFPAAANSSEGVMQAAAEKGVYSIGVDIDRVLQYSTAHPEWCDVILTSEIQNIEGAVYNAMIRYAKGELPMGTKESIGVAEGGTGIVKEDCLDNYKTLVPQDVRDFIDETEEKIVSGKIVVGTAYDMSEQEISDLADSVALD